MDGETDRAASIFPEERCEEHDEPFKTSKKACVVALKRKMDGFENQLATIRARLEARRELESPQRDFHLPAVNPTPNAASGVIPSFSSSIDRLKLPLLRRIDGTRVANAPPRDPFLEVENVIHRTMTRELYVRDADIVTTKELAAASATKDAQQLGEEARKRMVAYTQNESGWRFEERTSRYQQVMEMKQRAEKAQQEAELQRDTVRQMKALLRDPYKELRSSPVPRNDLTPLASTQDTPFRRRKDFEWIWILASPSTKLAFTPREESPNNVIDSEKELSMYVVYYIATSGVDAKRVETAEQWEKLLNDDCPPTTGWIGCSVHGVPPAPELISVRSGIQTWSVAGAGAGHLNGKYVACGVHDNVRRFKSSAGVELFRKCVPVDSSLAQVLHGGETARPESASSCVTADNSRAEEDSATSRKIAKPGVVLPSGLAAIEKDELDFRSMQRVGSWLSMNESIQRNRRMLASRSASDELGQQPGTSSALKLDGSSVMNQESREVEDASDLVESRPEISVPLCREWVLFARCSRLRADKATAGVSEPPMKGVGLGCLKRHYYISFEEKREMTIWAQTKESWLEKNVLNVIIEREAQLDRVQHLSRRCMTKFQQNLRDETEKTKTKLLAELNRVRFLTVKVLETIDRWRQHSRKIGFARYDSPVKHGSKHKATSDLSSKNDPHPGTEAPLLGWSSSITLDTGKQLYKGSKAFVSKIKRFRRSEDVTGKKEQHIVYLGYFETQEEAERAYDEHAASEARRLNTTVEHLPRRRNVFRSCGKHYAVESEKDGPSFCIECKTKQLASMSSSSADEWTPPFFFGAGVNYIMKMANDLDFLDDVLPLKAALNRDRGVDEAFPLRGNVFLLPKTPIQDPDLAVFTTFPTPTAPRLGENSDGPCVNDIDDEALDCDRIFKAQHIFLQELQIYRPELISKPLEAQNTTPNRSTRKINHEISSPQYRLVEALYWDHCAALKIQQQRPPLALRQDNIWCRPDEGEWASLVVRGAHQLHFLFEEKLEKSGKEMVQRRQHVLAALRQLNKVPLYFVPSRTNFTELIEAGQQVRGDVVQLEVNNATKRLQRYDSWCTMSLVVQRWFRGVLGRQKARATSKALRFAYKLRVFYAEQVASMAKAFYEVQVRSVAIRKAYKTICTPIYTRSVMMDGELVVVTFHSLRHYLLNSSDVHNASVISRLVLPSSCCTSCARRHHVKARYQSHSNKFSVLRGVCTCSVCDGNSEEGDRAAESWLIRAYSPSHNVIYRLRLGPLQLEQLLSSQTQAQLYLQPSIFNYRPLVMDMETTKLKAAVASRYAMFCLQNAEKAASTLANWRRMNNEATQTRKSLMVALEKSLSLLDSTKYAHGVSVINAKKALDFASRPFAEAQAWDPLENANDWRYIVEKRQLVKRLEETQLEVERLRIAHFQATYNEQYARAGAAHAQEDYNQFWTPLVEHESQTMEDAILRETTAKTRMESFMEQLCDCFLTLRDGYLIPTRRNLAVQSPLWHDMVPFRLDIPGLRRRLNYLRRRTLVLSNLAKQIERTRRMIVTVSIAPLITRSSKQAHTNRDIWVTAYDPIDCSLHNIFLEWELVQLLTGSEGRKIWQNSVESKRSAWRSIADILLSLTMLDRFTGEFTLQKLQFYHTLRRLSPQFLSSRVMRDLQAGRKCGQGDEILRQVVPVDGKLCVVVVYENWGDLTFAIYHTASGDFFRLVMSLRVVFDLLGSKPLMLRLWISCVKSNSYAATLLVYLLKYVRFYKCVGGGEDVRIEYELPAQKRSNRYQALVRIQRRQVFVSIVEDSAGDFQISGYDVRRELMYKLLLEREGLHRILKTSVLSDDLDIGKPLATSASALLLRRNRTELYEWICSRLRFQSMLEHPELITSGTSPLVFGLHLRESFRILNQWIATSPRNPLHAVSATEITCRASSIDAAAFSSLQFDQLTLVAHQRLPFDLEKEYVGTMDWIEAVAGSSSTSWKTQLPYMKMDFFVKAHTLFARLRGELEAETKERRKRETWAGMEQEDRNALCVDTLDMIESATKYITCTSQKLADLHAAARKRSDQWQQVHSQLQVAMKSTEMKPTNATMPAILTAARMLKEDNIRVFLEVLELWIPSPTTDLFEFMMLAVPVHSSSPLVVVSTILQACLERVEFELKASLTNLELTFERIRRSDDCVEDLRIHKKRVLRFCNLLTCHSTTSTYIEEAESETPPVGADEKNIVVQQNAAVSTISTDLVATNGVNTGLLIPSNSDEPIQEVFLADFSTWDPSSKLPFVVYAQDMVKHLRSFFQQQWRQHQVPGSRVGRRASNANGVLTCRRVHYGVLVYQAVKRDSYSQIYIAQLNARAVSLMGGAAICGPALFWPLQGRNEWYQRLIDNDAVHRALASYSEDVEPEEFSHKRPAAVRSTKYLPWKQFAIERLRIARAVKRSRTTEGVSVDSLVDDSDHVEKDERTITTTLIGFRQLELSLGLRSIHGGANIMKAMKHLFALHEGDQNSDGLKKWRVSLSDPRILHNILDVYDLDGRTIQTPSIGRENKDAFKIQGTQVEVDDVKKPRRLLFACRELQTQRKYFVDCDYYQLRCLLLQRSQHAINPEPLLLTSLQAEVKWRRQSEAMRVQDWRKLAALAAQFLMFRMKNGVLSLCLELFTPDIHVQEDIPEPVLVDEKLKSSSELSASEEQPARQPDTVDDKSALVQLTQARHICRVYMLEEQRAVKRSFVRHFQKHQPAIRAASCGRILARTASPSDLGSRTATEWMQMTQEDWRSLELRGMLVLDSNVLQKLEKAYTPATRQARTYLNTSTKEDDVGGLELQLKEIAKAMAQTAFLPDEVKHLQSIRMIRWRRRGKESSATAKRAEAYLADVAEWWRRRLTTMQPEMK